VTPLRGEGVAQGLNEFGVCHRIEWSAAPAGEIIGHGLKVPVLRSATAETGESLIRRQGLVVLRALDSL